MPMFGSTTGGKSGMASAPGKDDEATSKGAKAKEDTVMEPHAPITATTRAHQGRHPPNKACQTYVPQNALPYCLA